MVSLTITYIVKANLPGTLVRIGPNEIVSSDPDVWRLFLGTSSRYTRSTWFDGARLDPNHDNIVSQRDEKLHAELRAKMAMGVSKALSR
jgi:hypothetical protein